MEGIDIIIGAHSHDLLVHPILVEKENGKTAIVQAGKYGKYLGKLMITFQETAQETVTIKTVTEELYRIDTKREEEEDVKRIVERMKEEKKKISARIIGETAVDLNAETEKLQFGKSNLGNLITDAFLAKAKEKHPQVDFALMNGGGIRASICAGTITMSDIIKVLPFSKTLMILKATGEEIREALEYGLSPQVSQLKITFNWEKPIGHRITDIFILRDNKFMPIENNKKYFLATNSFVGSGKDNFSGFKTAEVF